MPSENIVMSKEFANKLTAGQNRLQAYNAGHDFYVFETSVGQGIICGEYNVDIVIRRLSDQKLFLATYKTMPLFASLEDLVPAMAFGSNEKESVIFKEVVTETVMKPHTIFKLA